MMVYKHIQNKFLFLLPSHNNIYMDRYLTENMKKSNLYVKLITMMVVIILRPHK